MQSVLRGLFQMFYPLEASIPSLQDRQRPFMTRLKIGLLAMAGLVVAAGMGGVVGAGAAIALIKTSYNGPVNEDSRSELAVHSDVLGESVQLGIRLPIEYASDPDRRFPVLWVLGASHGDMVYRATQTLAQAGIAEPAIVVELPRSSVGRTEDFTPPQRIMHSVGGQGDRYLRFLETEAMPAVDETFRTEPVRILVGHSLGGLFALYAFAERPSLFDAHFVFSPSTWVGRQAIVPVLQRTLREGDTDQTFLYLSLGSEEGNRMLSGFEAVRATLTADAPPGLRWQMDITTGADHGSNPILSYPVAVSRYWGR